MIAVPRIRRCSDWLAAAVAIGCVGSSSAIGADDRGAILENAGRKVVKLHGTGSGRVEGYGTGVLVSPRGHILTHLGPVLDGGSPTVVLADGRRFAARIEGFETRLEVALLRIDADDLLHFTIQPHGNVEVGDRVYALSNLFRVAAGAEPVSLQRGVIAAETTLEGRQGFFRFRSPTKVLVIDQTVCNPGAAGGALCNGNGELVGILGPEAQNALTGTWVSFAHPIETLAPFVESAVAGRPTASLDAARRPDAPLREPDWRGLLPVPPIGPETPPYIDAVAPGSSAERAGALPDDLILFVGETPVATLEALRLAFARMAPGIEMTLVVLRNDQTVILELSPSEEAKP